MMEELLLKTNTKNDMNKNYITIIIVLILSLSVSAFAQKKIVILHTNDTHSRIEPLPETDKYAPNKGGVVRRANYIESVRAENKNVLLFDAGDFVQGTPYYNVFGGEVETKAMNMLKYDAATLGNHEFDYGLEGLKDILDWAQFPIISSNYDFSETILKDRFDPYLIIVKDGVKIGVIGLNVKPQGLIATANYTNMVFMDPLETGNELATKLKNEDKCDVVICLSHLGYTADKRLAENSRNIDIIIGGHSHTYMKDPDIIKNADNEDILIYQTQGRGVYVGRIDIELEKN